MNAHNAVSEFIRRYQSLSAHRDSYDHLIKDLIVYSESIESKLRVENANLVSRIRDTELSLEDATRSRRELQQQVRQLEVYRDAVLQDHNYLKVAPLAGDAGDCSLSWQNSNPYVIALLDGDCLLFKETFIKQGVEGGKKAAYTLRAAILEQCGAHANSIEVISTVYANLAGLCKAMRNDGSLGPENDLKSFTLGFTQAKVILGISHDAGYAPFLDELFQDPSLRVRVTVLEGIPTVREVAATGVNILNMNDSLFRSEKPVPNADLVPCSPVTPVALPHYGPVSPAGAKTMTTSDTSTGIPTPSTSATSTPGQVTATTYALAVKNPSPPPPISSTQPKLTPMSPTRPQPAKSTIWNPGPRGLDTPLKVSQAALDAVKKRRDQSKLCNNHYLRGPCAKGTACAFEHKYRPTPNELVAIAFLARLNPCSNGQKCEVVDCIYGHHCPSVQSGVCTHPFCKFGKEEHPPGTKVKAHKP
ncbi:hypothetical protein CHGG_08191 [Chaetomium globosum CBS 148.51]|uniref:C3H1-type domain-containing protein n=1 Tax=Chaetomium globosum (strain ATCC 6205 / CBS 148.51 / DSM 1962 / NBRC 6347 / NRRL 1970) TaxID=306901 RepID=Q2GV13_CHAGB|nr:uncharacterized protein CHGG_08191 [Chaetomium globosum CBS 148.51]EAQ86938.1 hypothetical protein CHGG_08191 [Chaetomium globosum CBS 148.51]